MTPHRPHRTEAGVSADVALSPSRRVTKERARRWPAAVTPANFIQASLTVAASTASEHRLRRRVAGFAIKRKLADQRRAWFTHYDLNDFRCLGVRLRKLAEERRKAAVPAR
jgi:hypothetical protein